MICVSVGRTRHKMMIAEHRYLADKGAQLVELRLDFIKHTPDLTRLLNGRPTPVIVTCRRAQDKGLWASGEEQRLTTLRAAIVAGVEYVDLEEDTAKLIRRYGQTKRIISYHNFDETPHDLEAIHNTLAKCDADVVKIATMANTPGDNVRMLKLVAEAKIPTVAFCMGEMGVPSRILCGRYGSPWTYATVSQDRSLAPGQLTFEEMKDVYRFDSISKETELYGVMGDPIGHSLSPLLHNTALAKLGLNKAYLPLRVPKDLLKITLDQFQWLGFKGYSVTLPLKEAVLELFDHYDGPVREIGAANTLFQDYGGQWWAANSDIDAAIDSLKAALAEKTDDPLASDLAGKRVMVLGAGGASRALSLGLIKAGAALTLTNRSKDRGKDLADKLGCQYVSWENRGSHFADILVNCTSVGMFPKVDESPFTENWLREEMLVFDTVYTPEQTLLIKNARERGCRTVTGVEMFVRQAAKQFQWFNGQEASLDDFRAIVRKAISAAKV